MADFPRAFLSYSAANRDFVESVATDLGRQSCFYDKQSFQSAAELTVSIEAFLRSTNLFVLFATHASLQAGWVQFELDQAFELRLQKQLERVLVLRLETDLPISRFPIWIRKCKIVDIQSYKHAVREIRQHLGELLVAHKQPLFVGRSAELRAAEGALFPQNLGNPPRVMAFVGLTAIGRRSVARRTAENVLGFRMSVEINLESTDNVQDLAFKLAAEIEAYSGQSSLLQIQDRISKLSDDLAITYTTSLIKKIVETNSIPIFIDRGGLMSEDGTFSEKFQPLLSNLFQSSDIYLFLITNRKPPFSTSTTVPYARIDPLSRADSVKLLMALAARNNVTLKPQQYEELSDYVGGFPPSCNYIIQMIKAYKLDLVMANKTPLVNFRVAAFVSYIKKHSSSPSQETILRLIANHSPLPLPVINSFCNLDLEETASIIAYLADISMIVPTTDGMFSIAEPLRDAVYKQANYFKTSEYRKLAVSINEWFANNDLPFSLEFSRTVYKIANQAGDTILAESVAHLAADTFHLATRAYDSQNYEEACELLKSVLELRPDNQAALILFVKGLAHLAKWTECEQLCSKLELKNVPIRTTAFLRGFISRKKNRLKEAVTFFEVSRSAGRSDVAVLRELAWCHYIMGELDEAEPLLQKAINLQPDNRFLIDLTIQISAARGDLKTANEQLERLRLFDTEASYWHRRATIKENEGDLAAAIDAGCKAISGETKPRFEALSHLIYCEIKAEKLSDARTHIAEMEKYFPSFRPEIRTALQSHLRLKAGQFHEVLNAIDQKSALANRFLGVLRSKAITSVLKMAGINEKDGKQLETDLCAIGIPSIDDEPNYDDLRK